MPLLTQPFFNVLEGGFIPSVIYCFNSSFPFTTISHSPNKRRVTVQAIQPLTLESLTPLLKEIPNQDQITIKNWQAYPIMKKFDKDTLEFSPFQLGPSFYYVNAIEPVISSMEVEIMAARNIIRMVLADISPTS